MPFLNKWSIGMKHSNIAPELQTAHLQGVVTGHPRKQDGAKVVTSAIRGQRWGYVVTASGSYYQLGTVDLMYERLYPHARERLFRSLEEI